jgi:hypothetical protein
MRITKNLDGMGRVIRIILGIVLLMLVSLGLLGPKLHGHILDSLALFLLLRGVSDIDRAAND